MATISTLLLFSFFFLSLHFHNSSAQTWIRAGYWYAGSESPIPDINSALFTHLLCAFANVNSSTYRLSIPSADEQYFSGFPDFVKRRNPAIKTLLSVWNGQAETYKAIVGDKGNYSVLSSMVDKPSNRKSFIDSSIKTARLYGFEGVDLFWLYPNSTSDMSNVGILLDEWRAAVDSESRNSTQSKLVLTMALRYVPDGKSMSYPIESLKRNLDWGHVVAYDYHLPTKENVTGAHAALYDPYSHKNTDYGVRKWLSSGFPSEKLVLGLPFHGYAWTLANPKANNGVGSPASSLAVTQDGSMSYQYIKRYTRSYRAEIVYNASYVVNYCVIGATWIGFDDVEAVKAKITYAKEKKLLGYNVFQVINDDNWVLSRAAQGEETDEGNKRRLLLLIILPVALIIILLAVIMFYVRRHKVLKSRGVTTLGYVSSYGNTNRPDAENLDSDAPNLQVFSFSKIKEATNNFLNDNKLGEGGFGIVYKGRLPRGQEIAVKRLSKTSTQGVEEFKNEVSLTARLQHVNLTRVLGYCTEREEKMLVYEYMPKNSLDFYIFDPIRRHQLDWEKRVRIIEGITQGLLYLQEYSNFTIIH
ncbi:Mitogen-activated protein kinase kinase kinase [Parasponia andersonii]|uniref:Mitogen-activated protein kinase kinase kinase n=1 Tax=Parasponia andersonii TaxID=3476 RepID=A0A2P5ANC5_PARAD|nr:Mitogen-activated protein kinase kinase kinase [Parasponia andersonii]